MSDAMECPACGEIELREQRNGEHHCDNCHKEVVFGFTPHWFSKYSRGYGTA